MKACHLLCTVLAFIIHYTAGTASAAKAPPSGPPYKWVDDDFVVAIPTAIGKRLIVALGTRVWREGVRTFMALNDSTAVTKLNPAPQR